MVAIRAQLVLYMMPMYLFNSILLPCDHVLLQKDGTKLTVTEKLDLGVASSRAFGRHFALGSS